MISTTSASKMNAKGYGLKQVFVDELRKNMPLSISFTLLSLVIILLPNWLQMIEWNRRLGKDQISYFFSLSPFSVVLFPVFGLLLGIFQFAYLTNRRTLDVFFALPVKRSTAVVGRILSGIFMLTVPTILSYLLLFLMNLVTAGFHIFLLQEFFFDIFAAIVILLVPYTLTVLISTLTGTIVENIIYTLVLLFVPVLIVSMSTIVLSEEIYGFTVSDGFTYFFHFLCPFVVFFISSSNDIFSGITRNLLAGLSDENVSVSFYQEISSFLLPLFFWLVISIVLLVLSCSFFVRRKSEVAGKKNVSRVLNNITCVFVMLFTAMFFYLMLVYSAGITLYPILLICIIIAFVVYQLVIFRSVQGMFRAYKTGLVGVLLCVLCLIGVKTEFFGYYHQIPTTDQIKSASVSFIGPEGAPSYDGKSYHDKTVFTELEEIEQLVHFQQTVINTKETEQRPWGMISIQYEFKDGKKMARQYQTISSESYQELFSMQNNESFIRQNHYSFIYDFGDFDQVTAMDLFQTHETDVSQQFDAAAFQQALQQDILKQSWTPDREESTMLGIIQLNEAQTKNNFLDHIKIYIKSSYENTIAYLQKAGLFELMTSYYEQIPEIFLMKVDESSLYFARNNYYSTEHFLYHTPEIFSTTYWESYQELSESYQTTSDVITRKVTDPQEIKEILSKVTTQCFYNKGDFLVYIPVKTNGNNDRMTDTVAYETIEMVLRSDS